MSAFDRDGIDRLGEVIAGHVEQDTTGGVAWLAARGDDVHVGTAGVLTRGEGEEVRRDTIFRIASMTKPMTAAAAMILVDECALRLEDPVNDLLPELANLQVLVDGRGPIDGPTVPANRPITLRDLLTFRLGWGMDFSAPWPQPLMDAGAKLGLGAGPPEPQGPPPPDEWLRRMSTLPLLYQPGERWLYNVGSDVLGILLGRATGQPLEAFLRERLFEPLGMNDTAFATPDIGRLGTCYTRDPASVGTVVAYDKPDGQWAKPPTFPSAAGGLVSTVDDVHAFARMMLAGGLLPDGTRLVSRASIEAMTTDQLAGAPGPSPDGSVGWGFGVGVQRHRIGPARTVASYGWDGGLGSSWANDPTEGLIGVVLTTDMFAGAFPLPAVIQDFWTCVYGAANASA